MRVWRNWQTRTFEGRMGDRMGSSPIIRTTKRLNPFGFSLFVLEFLNILKYLFDCVIILKRYYYGKRKEIFN